MNAIDVSSPSLSVSGSPPDLAVELKGLTKIYRGNSRTGPKQALKGIDLAIPRGSFFGLLGPNGAGKSTMINILAGLVIKTGGEAKIWGYDIDERPRQSRAAIGVVPQELILDPFFTPRELLDLQAGLYGVPRAERRTEELLKAVGLADKADAYARSLSGGMRRRLMVAKALVHTPPVLVLDEPTAGVDVELRQSLWEYVRALNKSGTTVLLTTHYLEEAQELCDTIAIINHGAVAACEPTSKLLGRMDRKDLWLVLDRDLTEIPAALGRFETQLPEPRRLIVRYQPSRENINEVLAAVRDAGLAITDLSTKETDLEDISFNSCRRRALSLTLALVLGLAGAARADTGPRIDVHSFTGSDGTEVPMRSWLPQGKAKAVIVALHGFADYSNAFAKPAAWWASQGIATFAYDQRGFGAAPHVFHWSGVETMVGDAREFTAILRRRYPGVPLYLMGESMGGAVTIAATTGPKPVDVDGAILVSPAVWEHNLMGSIERAALGIVQHTIPGLWLEAPRGLDIHPSDNIEMLRAMGHDSLVQFGARADTTAGLMDLMDQAGENVSDIRMPTLVLFGAHEEVLPEAAVTSFLKHIPAKNVRVALYPNGYHMLLRDLHGQIVWQDVADWALDRSAKLDSGNECAGKAAMSAPCKNR